jgi:hypothetical protein
MGDADAILISLPEVVLFYFVTNHANSNIMPKTTSVNSSVK